MNGTIAALNKVPSAVKYVTDFVPECLSCEALRFSSQLAE
jgi:hypothetical protein